jgi:hypothetical protein
LREINAGGPGHVHKLFGDIRVMVQPSEALPRRLGLLHGAAIGAATLFVLYLLCWLGAVLGWTGASHFYLALFTTAPAASVYALAQGLCLSLGFGALTGALVAFFHSLFGFLAPG